MAFWASRLILSKERKNSTLKDLGPRTVRSFWDFWTWVHLEELGLPISLMLCLMLSSEIHSCVLIISLLLCSLCKGFFHYLLCIPIYYCGVFLSISPLSAFGLISLFALVASYPMLSARLPRWPGANGGLLAYHISIALVHFILLVFYFPVKVIIFVRGNGSVDKKYTFTLSQLNFLTFLSFKFSWSGRNMVYGSMCIKCLTLFQCSVLGWKTRN